MGALDPGLSTGSTSAGTLTAGSGVLFTDTTGIFSIRIGLASGVSSSPGTGLGGDDDQLAVDGGTFSLDDTTLQILDGSAENNPNLIGNLYVIVNGGAASTGVASDVFANAPASGDSFTTADGFKYDVFYGVNPTNTSFGNDIDVELVAIPEPATWASLLGGIVLLIAWQRVRRRPFAAFASKLSP